MSSVVEYGARRTAVVAAVMLAAVMQLADTTIVNVALPTIDGSLGASTDDGAWFVTSFIIANVIVIPLSPWLMTVMGRRNYFALSIAGFTFTSILCGLADNATTEILLRFVQGAFGGGLLVPAQQIIRDTFPPKELGTSQSLFSLAIVMGPTIGPTLGGVLTDDVSWRWVFFVNVLPGIVATILTLIFIRDPAKPKRVPFDFIGFGLMAVGLATMQYVLDEGERWDWLNDPTIRAAAVVAVLALVAFVFYELFGTKLPAVALRVMRNRTVWAMCVINIAVGAAMYGLLFVQPIYTQEVLGFTTTLTGMMLMVRAGAMVVLFPVTRWLVSQSIDLRLVAIGGILVIGVSTWVQAGLMTTHSDFATFVVTQFLGGAGMAFFFVPLQVMLFQALEPAIVPPSLAITRLIWQVGGSIGSAFAATLLDRYFAQAYANLASGVTLTNSAVSAFVQTHAHGVAALTGLVAHEAQNIAAADATYLFGVMVLAVSALPFLLKRRALAPAPAPLPQPAPLRIVVVDGKPLPVHANGSARH